MEGGYIVEVLGYSSRVVLQEIALYGGVVESDLLRHGLLPERQGELSSKKATEKHYQRIYNCR